MKRKVFFESILDYTPSYRDHATVTAKDNLKTGMSWLEWLVREYECFCLYGVTLGYIDGMYTDLDRIQCDVREWIRELRLRDVKRDMLGLIMSFEEAEMYRPHSHVLIARSWYPERKVDFIEECKGIWMRVTQMDGVYFNENAYSENIEDRGGIGMLGMVRSNDMWKIPEVIKKVEYITKSGSEPHEKSIDKRRCFVCERYR